MDAMNVVESLIRWMHVVAGITWIGLLYFFNWVNIPFQAAIEGDAKKAVNPELLPRALYWFRWGAAWTWVTGVLLLMLVFYHGQVVFDALAGGEWNAMSALMVALTFALVFVYDAAMNVDAMKDGKTSFVVGVIGVGVMCFLYQSLGGFGYRGYVIHIGAMFGTMMAFNVWFRIWPAQQVIIKAVKAGEKPPADKAALAGLRSRHNTYMSIPLVWTMVNSHTTSFANNIIWVPVVVGMGWWIGSMLYKRSLKVEGF